jgi:hypothetical protein
MREVLRSGAGGVQLLRRLRLSGAVSAGGRGGFEAVGDGFRYSQGSYDLIDKIILVRWVLSLSPREAEGLGGKGFVERWFVMTRVEWLG